LRNVRDSGQWEMDRVPNFFITILVAFGFRHAAEQRVGHAEHDESDCSGPASGQQIRPSDARLGFAPTTHIQALDLGKEQQMVLEMRPAHNPTKAYGLLEWSFRLKDLSASIWLWHRADVRGSKEVIEIPAEPADPSKLPPMLKDFKAVPPWYRTLICAG